jgi:hypothetical protein
MRHDEELKKFLSDCVTLIMVIRGTSSKMKRMRMVDGVKRAIYGFHRVMAGLSGILIKFAGLTADNYNKIP